LSTWRSGAPPAWCSVCRKVTWRGTVARLDNQGLVWSQVARTRRRGKATHCTRSSWLACRRSPVRGAPGRAGGHRAGHHGKRFLRIARFLARRQQGGQWRHRLFRGIEDRSALRRPGSHLRVRSSNPQRRSVRVLELRGALDRRVLRSVLPRCHAVHRRRGGRPVAACKVQQPNLDRSTIYRHTRTRLRCWGGRTERLRLAGCSGGNRNAANRRQSKRGWTCQLAR
jgi:hypothetical protein